MERLPREAALSPIRQFQASVIFEGVVSLLLRHHETQRFVTPNGGHVAVLEGKVNIFHQIHPDDPRKEALILPNEASPLVHVYEKNGLSVSRFDLEDGLHAYREAAHPQTDADRTITGVELLRIVHLITA